MCSRLALAGPGILVFTDYKFNIFDKIIYCIIALPSVYTLYLVF